MINWWAASSLKGLNDLTLISGVSTEGKSDTDSATQFVRKHVTRSHNINIAYRLLVLKPIPGVDVAIFY